MQLSRYLQNLMAAICGSDPYRMELDRVREEYEKTAARVAGLDELCDEFRSRQAELAGQIGDYQVLVENFRGRISDKDEQIAQMKREWKDREADYQKRVADYSSQIAKLQQRLDGTGSGRTKQPRRKPKSSNEHRKGHQDAQA
jgi:chromosome segregation ATPase